MYLYICIYIYVCIFYIIYIYKHTHTHIHMSFPQFWEMRLFSGLHYFLLETTLASEA